MAYAVRYERRVEKQLAALPRREQMRIIAAVERLALDPFASPNVKALVGTDAYRLRVGSYRVIYLLDSRDLIVIVVDVGDRKDVYR